MDIFQQILAEVTAMNVLEIIAVITAITYVVLASMEKILCWLFGIISSAIFVYIFFQVNYQLDAILNIFYVLMGFYGWYAWNRGKNDGNTRPILSFNLKKMAMIFLVGTVISGMVGYIFDVQMHSSKPYLDAFTTVFAMMATLMVAQKILENWLIWILIDALSIYLYLHKSLYFTAFLFVIYIIIAVYGYLSWKKRLQTTVV